eukprot:3303213-Prymnesium_polylepis.1
MASDEVAPQKRPRPNFNQKRAVARRAWRALLERYGILSGRNLDQDKLQQVLQRLQIEGKEAERVELARAAAGRLQSSVEANMCKRSRQDGLEIKRQVGRKRTEEAQKDAFRLEGMLPGVNGARASQLALKMLEGPPPPTTSAPASSASQRVSLEMVQLTAPA